ncbi:HpcH/HpaI aldolase family protein [Aestuariibacter salexigens]|uniref:HpcH/HpaI aldolase family protein n=1 Tax=Aestuariibacter salexigens TaxID=226010 RepID=UPI000402723F|nr:aldolase/citrate lyase family protein [Aestuariibacter salexigens]
MYRQNHLLGRLRKGDTVFGTWSMTGSAMLVEALGTTPLDYIILDMEHGAMSYETIEHMVRACEVTSTQAIVRLSNGESQNILRALETGCRAIMVPHVSTVAEAERVVSACRYAPEGSRGLSPYTRNHQFTHEGLSASLQRENQETLVGVLVEGNEGIANLKDIAKVKGLDLIYTGIYDISQSVGLAGQIDHPDVMEMQRQCVSWINEGSAAPGSFANSIDYAQNLLSLGFRFIAYAADSYTIKRAYTEDIAKLKTFKGTLD